MKRTTLTAVEDPPTRLPSFSLTIAQRRAGQVLEQLQPWLDRRIDDRVVQRIAEAIAGIDKRLDATILAISLDDLQQQPVLRLPMARRAAWRLGANFNGLVRQQPVPASPDYVARHWARVVVRDAGIVTRSGKDRREVRILIRLLSGQLAGQPATIVVSPPALPLVFRRLVGLCRRVPFRFPRQLVALSAAVRPVVFDGEIQIEMLSVGATQQQDNARLARRRVRDLHSCPKRRPVDCVYCPVGRNECEYAINPHPTEFFRSRTHDGSAGEGSAK